VKVRDLNHGRLIFVDEGTTLRAAAEQLAEEEIGAIAILGARGPVGIFSERDLARAVADDTELDEEEVDAYMTRSPISIAIDASVPRAVEKMNEFGVRHLLVLDDGDPVGMISMRDVLAHLTKRPTFV
jgi:CBS domain-containing protein